MSALPLTLREDVMVKRYDINVNVLRCGIVMIGRELRLRPAFQMVAFACSLMDIFDNVVHANSQRKVYEVCYSTP